MTTQLDQKGWSRAPTYRELFLLLFVLNGGSVGGKALLDYYGAPQQVSLDRSQLRQVDERLNAIQVELAEIRRKQEGFVTWRELDSRFRVFETIHGLPVQPPSDTPVGSKR